MDLKHQLNADVKIKGEMTPQGSDALGKDYGTSAKLLALCVGIAVIIVAMKH
ncbi:hypothetical protein GCM10011613_36160 [Cellvibrio zantedeschiae]|uniref:Uncharacterized protein n=1 Tax=Cellvibrio zantedeschiae TaxID=1237077 RepID=A0ABQ3BDE1_9GAMM|nr:hypothetical protein [Cellvibrio zantedeschiae]GGY87906.1 hypothetical protein GCM10011613_36160 [Cellvibrio zantedeschiae]